LVARLATPSDRLTVRPSDRDVLQVEVASLRLKRLWGLNLKTTRDFQKLMRADSMRDHQSEALPSHHSKLDQEPYTYIFFYALV